MDKPMDKPSHPSRRTPLSLGSCTILLGIIPLLGCGDLRRDEGLVCIPPVDCNCVAEDFDDCLWECTSGDYPADTPLAAFVTVEAHPEEIESPECWGEIVGEFRLEIQSKYRHLERNAAGGFSTSFECEMPTLEPGTWTIVYAGQSAELVLPSDDVPILCVPALD